jgi:hypothetical protein
MTHLKNTVMLRVRTIALLRPLVSTSALCLALVFVSAYAVSREVWVDMVFRNMPSPADFGAFTNFFASAFIHTGFIVQAFCVLATVATVFLAREITKIVPAFSLSRA